MVPSTIPGLLRQAISQAKIPNQCIRYTSALRCSNVPNIEDHAKNIKKCRKHLLDEIAEHKPKVVLTVGASAHASLSSGGADNFHTIVRDERGFYRINIVPTLNGTLNNKLRLELFSAMKKVTNLIQDITFPPDAKYVIVDSERQLELAEKILMNAPELVFDFETGTDLDRDANGFQSDDTLLCCGFSWGTGRAIVIPLDHKDNLLDKEKCHNLVKKVLTNSTPKIAHNCLPGDAEVLTKHGWVSFKNLKATRYGTPVEVAQYNKDTKAISWTIPNEIIKKAHTGPLIKASTRGLDLLCTPEHRLLHQNKDGSPYRTDLAIDRYHTRTRIVTSGVLNNTEEHKIPWVELLVAVQADAHLTETRAHFNLAKKEKIDRLLSLCSKYSVPIKEIKRQQNSERSFALSGPVIRQIYGLIGKNKLWDNWVLNLELETRTRLLEELKHWDGRDVGTDRGTYLYTSKHIQNVEWIATLVHLNGKSASITPNNTCYSVTIRPTSTHIIKPENWSKVDGNTQYVYCLNVDTSYFLVRYKGSIHVTGNCIYDQYAAYHFYNGLEVQNLTFDTMLAHHLLDPTQGTHSLKYLTGIYTEYGGYEEAIHKHLAGPDGKRSYGNVPLDVLSQYCAVDVDMTYRLKEKFAPEIRSNEKLNRVFKQITMPTSEVFYGIRKEGMYVNKSKLDKIRAYYTTMLQDNMKILYANSLITAHAPALNIGSPKQLQHLLYDVLKLRIVKTTEKLSPSTDEEALNRLTSLYRDREDVLELLECILAIRKANKYLSTYVEGLSGHITDSKIYTTYLLHGTTSARPSSIKPNLLNIPSESTKYTPLDCQIKSIFEAPPGYIFCSADFSQIELRNIGNETQEPELVDAYLQRMDMHTKTASLIFGVDISCVEDYQRKIGKTTNFGGAYGAGPATLAAQIESQGSLSDEELVDALKSVGIYHRSSGKAITADERNDLMIKLAKYIQQTLFQKWSVFGKWQRKQRDYAERERKVYSRFGRCRYLHFPPNATNSQKWKLINTAVNYPIQSVSSDCLMLSMIRINKEFRKRGMKSKIVGQVYDSINYYIWEDEKDVALSLIKTVMELEPLIYDPDYFTIPMEVDIALGPNWADLAKVEGIKYLEGVYQ